MMRKSIELYLDEHFTITETSDGTRIHGRLAYPGISKNGKLYTIDQIMAGHNLDLPVWLNHADAIGISDIGEDLLPASYRQRLLKGDIIILGRTHLTFNPDTLELMYDAVITDPFYKRKDILKRMAVSQGVLHFEDLPKVCDTITCYKLIQGSEYEEMSLVFHPGFPIMTLSIENQNVYELQNMLKDRMSGEEDKTKSGEADCDCKKSKEVDQAGGTMTQAGQCGEGQVWDATSGMCVAVPNAGNPATNAGGSSPSQVAGEAVDPKITKAEEALKKAREVMETATTDLKKAKEDLQKTGEMHKDEDEDDKPKEKKSDESDKRSAGSGPNADSGSRAKAQEKYNENLEKHYKAIEASQAASDAYVKTVMAFAKEHATKTATIASSTEAVARKKSLEAANLMPKQWIDKIIKSPEMAPWNMTWMVTPEYIDTFVVKKFKSAEGAFLTPKYTPYKQHMEYIKSVEATDVAMAGGTDPNNFQRTLSELVLVYPDGIIVTPIQQFCETAILPPGKKEHLFYDVNVPTFGPTDESNMDAGGSGYALVPSTVTINASGGKTSPQGGLVRIGFSQLEEFPIDIIQKVNVGFSMRAEDRKNFEVLTTSYNDDTAYNPATDAVRPKGGGNKGAADTQGNTHWVNGNTGAQLTTTDVGATAALTFAGLLAAKKTIGDTGLNVENLQTYLPYGGILQVIKDPGITTYLQRSVPEVITEGYIERISGTQLIASSQTPTGSGATVKRACMFIPIVSFGFVTGRELQVDAERVARQQSVFCTASMKIAAFCKRIESTCRVSFAPAA